MAEMAMIDLSIFVLVQVLLIDLCIMLLSLKSKTKPAVISKSKPVIISRNEIISIFENALNKDVGTVIASFHSHPVIEYVGLSNIVRKEPTLKVTWYHCHLGYISFTETLLNQDFAYFQEWSRRRFENVYQNRRLLNIAYTNATMNSCVDSLVVHHHIQTTFSSFPIIHTFKAVAPHKKKYRLPTMKDKKKNTRSKTEPDTKAGAKKSSSKAFILI